MDSKFSSPLVKAMHIATSGMQVQSQRMLVISQNIANANSNQYQRQTITFKNEIDKNHGVNLVKVKKIGKDKSPPHKVYQPGHPEADRSGYVTESNVKPVVELTDMREAGRSHEANLRAFEKILAMLQNTVNLLKNS